jgi:hypothetical protein
VCVCMCVCVCVCVCPTCPCFLCQGVDHTADVYAFGISLYEFIERKIPFSHHSDIKTFLQAVVLDLERPVLSEDPLQVPASLRQLCEECWAADKTQRPTFQELLHRFPTVLTDCAIFDEVCVCVCVRVVCCLFFDILWFH